MSSVDVIVPCYRYGHFLRQCVESVLAQSGPNVRVLIIDDASPDNTSEVAVDLASGDSRVIFFRHATNRGHIQTYNEGIEWACADYMLLLSADDYLLPSALSRSATIMDAHGDVGFTFGRAITLDDRGGARQTNIATDNATWRILTGVEFIKLSKSRNIVPTPTAVVRTELLKRLGGYRPELPHCGDMELWLRLAANASVGMLEANQAVYRLHAGNMSLGYTAKTWLPDLQQRKAAFDCFFETSSSALLNPQQLRRKLLWLLGCDAISFASAAFNEGRMEGSKKLSEFALAVCPEVRGSLPWIGLTCKRALGYKAWRALQPAVDRIRHGSLSFKRMVRTMYDSLRPPHIDRSIAGRETGSHD